MQEDPYHEIETLLASSRPEDLREGLALVKKEISVIGSAEARPLFEIVATVFYIDRFDRPDLAPVLEEAITLVVGFGNWVIPALLEQLDSSDFKAQFAIARALGQVGVDAIEPLIAEYESSSDADRRAFVLYALGKIKSPKIVRAVHLAMEAAESPERELRDTGTRAIGKFAESIPPADVPADVRRGFIETLRKNLADQNAAIRAKAVRSLGKLARCGHLDAKERESLNATLLLLLGKDEHFDWDPAYLVRKEAEEALEHVQP